MKKQWNLREFKHFIFIGKEFVNLNYYISVYPILTELHPLSTNFPSNSHSTPAMTKLFKFLILNPNLISNLIFQLNKLSISIQNHPKILNKYQSIEINAKSKIKNQSDQIVLLKWLQHIPKSHLVQKFPKHLLFYK